MVSTVHPQSVKSHSTARLMPFSLCQLPGLQSCGHACTLCPSVRKVFEQPFFECASSVPLEPSAPAIGRQMIDS